MGGEVSCYTIRTDPRQIDMFNGGGNFISKLEDTPMADAPCEEEKSVALLYSEKVSDYAREAITQIDTLFDRYTRIQHPELVLQFAAIAYASEDNLHLRSDIDNIGRVMEDIACGRCA
jgi:hypothetical protein